MIHPLQQQQQQQKKIRSGIPFPSIVKGRTILSSETSSSTDATGDVPPTTSTTSSASTTTSSTSERTLDTGAIGRYAIALITQMSLVTGVFKILDTIVASLNMPSMYRLQ